jgi:hypothetical protein
MICDDGRVRYDPEPAVRFAAAKAGRPVCTGRETCHLCAGARSSCYGPKQFGIDTGFSASALSKWRRDGGIPWRSADEVAIALGVHPCHLWGVEWWDDIVAEVEAAETSRGLAIERRRRVKLGLPADEPDYQRQAPEPLAEAS